MNRKHRANPDRVAFLATSKALEELRQRIQLEDDMAALRARLEAQKDLAHMVLAAELLCLRGQLDCYWFELPEKLGVRFDHSLLFKLAKRQTYTSKATHGEICQAINRHRTVKGLSPVDFPTWVTWQEMS